VTVLLVENDTMVRGFVRKLLKMEGYHLLEAANGAEAIRQCERYHGPIHLLLTDVEMPRMNGRELADVLTKSRQEMKVLFMSGCTGDEILHEAIRSKVVAFIQKPFAPDAMRHMVRELVGVSTAASA
jgi:CheY-like chemotaxis protein